MNMKNEDKAKKKPVKRQQLVEAAKTLFFKYGLKRVTVEEICEIAGVSKVTFYKYFQDKTYLAEIIRDELVKTGFSRFDEIKDLNISYPEKIDLMTQWRIRFLSQMSSEFIEEIMSLEDIHEEVKTRYLRNITDAQENGEIWRDISPELIWLVSEKLTEIITEGSWNEIFTDYKEFQKQLRKLYFYGLLER